MEYFNNYIKKNLSFIITIFIIIQPFLDLLVSLSKNVFFISFNFGILVRVLFLLFIMFISIFTFGKRKNIIYYMALFIYSIFYLLANLNNGGVLEVHGLIRVLYFPIMLCSLYSIRDNFKISNLSLMVNLFTYVILLFIAYVTNTGFDSYAIAKDGSIGFFNSTNEISNIITILFPISLIIFKDKWSNLLKGVLLILFFYVISKIGTKTPILGIFIVFVFLFLYFLISSIKKKRYKMCGALVILFIVLGTSVSLIIPKTTFYKNIKIHLNYLKINNILNVLDDPFLFDHFVFSQRISFFENTSLEYDKSSVMSKLFGIGYIGRDNKNYKMIEMDYYDIFYSQGIIGFILIMGPYLFVLYNVFKDINEKFSFSKYMNYLSLILILVLSLFSGHVIISPSVSFLCIILILNLLKREKRDLLFTAVDLRIGGIENALINLLDNINYNKYNVRLYLENKKGEGLSRLNNSVLVYQYSVSSCKNIFFRKFINLFRRLVFMICNYNLFDFSCCYATYSFSGSKISKIASLNNSIYIHSDYSYIYKDENQFLDFFGKRQIWKFKRIFIVSNEARDNFIKFYPGLKDRVLVFNNFVNVKEITKLSREKISFSANGKYNLVFVGRLDDSSKKLGRCLNIVKNIKDINLTIVGDGPDRDMYMDIISSSGISDRVFFVGSKSNPYPYILKSDYLILTSLYEGFPVTFLEAIVLNKPIISTINVSDDNINIGNNFGYIISSDSEKMVSDVRSIFKSKKKFLKIDLLKIQKNRMKRLEKIFDEVV